MIGIKRYEHLLKWKNQKQKAGQRLQFFLFILSHLTPASIRVWRQKLRITVKKDEAVRYHAKERKGLTLKFQNYYYYKVS